MYQPVYAALGVNAILVSAGGATVSLSVIDGTSGIVLTDKVGVETVRPIAYVRNTELASNGISSSDLPDSELTLNGSTWRVKASRPRPSPNGESDGETMLILLSEG
jgi:hypothetical protein